MKKLVLFSEYMRQFEREDSPRGDLARDMRDSPMPELLKYREYIRWMKYEKHACKEAVETFIECYHEYKKEHKRDVNILYSARKYMKENNIGVGEVLARSSELRTKTDLSRV